ncbi:MAG: DUF1456 family protein [Arenicella sp.]
MTNNDILRRLRYTFDFNDSKMMTLFALAGYEASREEVCDWLKKDGDDTFKNCNDKYLATFLNGLIIEKRGRLDGPLPVAEKNLDNNIILKKLKIALNLQAEDIISLLGSSGLHLSKHELSALFRKPGHKHYRQCKDQILRNFLQGLQDKHHAEI